MIHLNKNLKEISNSRLGRWLSGYSLEFGFSEPMQMPVGCASLSVIPAFIGRDRDP